MTVPFNGLNSVNWENLLLNSHVQSGGALVGFRGTPYQRGFGIGSLFRTLFRIAKPISKSIIKNVAKEGFSSALQVGSDMLEGKDLKSSVAEHSRAAGKRLLKKGVKSAKKRLQKGSGRLGFVSKKSIKRKKKQVGYGLKKTRRISKKKDYLDL